MVKKEMIVIETLNDKREEKEQKELCVNECGRG